VHPAVGGSIRQGLGPLFALFNKYLGDQWTVNNWDGMRAAAATEVPAWIRFLMAGEGGPPQNLKEYDPEWGRAFISGSVAASCDHERMLSSVKVPVLLTHHFRMLDEETGGVRGALADVQAKRVRELITAAGQPVEYVSLPTMGHSLHGQDPALFVKVLMEWASKLA
jgi:pimeloyl-ACP methyl ester carboxylesterase